MEARGRIDRSSGLLPPRPHSGLEVSRVAPEPARETAESP
jgi:hypothetical protein